jgi:hypothetical protein
MFAPSLAAESQAVSGAVAAGAALLGVAAGAGISFARDRRERNRRQLAAIRNFRRELEANRRSCSSNLTLLKTEDRDLREGRGLGHTNSLQPMLEGAWTLVFLDLPGWMLSDTGFLSDVETMLSICRRINGDLQAREAFHLRHLLVDREFLTDGLSRFARILIYPQEDLILRTDSLASLLDERPRRASPFRVLRRAATGQSGGANTEPQ